MHDREDGVADIRGADADGSWTSEELRAWGWDRLTSTYRTLDARHAELVVALEREARRRHAAEFEHWAQLMGDEPYPAHDVIFDTRRLALSHRRSMLLAEALRRVLEDFGVEPGDLTLRLDMMQDEGRTRAPAPRPGGLS